MGLVSLVRSLATDWHYFPLLACLLITADVLLTAVIIAKVPCAWRGGAGVVVLAIWAPPAQIP